MYDNVSVSSINYGHPLPDFFSHGIVKRKFIIKTARGRAKIS